MLNFRHILGRRAAILLILAGLAVAAGLIINKGADEFVVPTAIGETNETFQETEDFQYLERANRAFINLVAKTRPSIVQIVAVSKRRVDQTNPRGQIFPPDGIDREELRRFLERQGLGHLFEDEKWDHFLEEHTQPFSAVGIGSGVIVSEDGYILTNSHVIDRANEITVTLSSGKKYNAKLIGKDPGRTAVSGTDLAVLKIDAKDLHTLPFGDSDALEVGEWVIAIGAPLNLSQTVTRGIVSAKDRDSASIRYSNIEYGSFIQTDAPINHGNSGGALINIRGELVGINTLIATNGFTSGNIGIGFAIPSNTARDILPQLIKHGEIVRAWLGINMASVSPELAEKLGFDSTRGVLVHEVGKGSPAEKSGIQHGDIILEFNKKPIRDSSHLMHTIGATAVGKSVEIKVLRNGKEKQLTAKLEKRTAEAIATLRPSVIPDPTPMYPEELPETEVFAGMHVQNLTPELAMRYRHRNETGVIVMKVEVDSEAAENGIQTGYLIKEIDYKPIENLKDYEKIVKELKKGDDEFALVYVKDLNHRGNYFTLKINSDEINSDDR